MTDYYISSPEDLKVIIFKDGDSLTLDDQITVYPPETFSECLIASGYPPERAEELERRLYGPKIDPVEYQREQDRRKRAAARGEVWDFLSILLFFVIVVIAWSLPEALQ